jgi:hypothetical protein
MPKFLLAYHGGADAPETEQAQAELITAWGDWLSGLGELLLDPGNPTVTSATLTPDGLEPHGGSNPVSGYSLIEADDLGAVAPALAGCPIFEVGGSIEIAELEPF